MRERSGPRRWSSTRSLGSRTRSVACVEGLRRSAGRRCESLRSYLDCVVAMIAAACAWGHFSQLRPPSGHCLRHAACTTPLHFSERSLNMPHRRTVRHTTRKSETKQAQQSQPSTGEQRDEANKHRFVDQTGVEARDLPGGGRDTVETDPHREAKRNLPQQHGGEIEGVEYS